MAARAGGSRAGKSKEEMFEKEADNFKGDIKHLNGDKRSAKHHKGKSDHRAPERGPSAFEKADHHRGRHSGRY